jgi:hypothetical protein
MTAPATRGLAAPAKKYDHFVHIRASKHGWRSRTSLDARRTYRVDAFCVRRRLPHDHHPLIAGAILLTLIVRPAIGRRTAAVFDLALAACLAGVALERGERVAPPAGSARLQARGFLAISIRLPDNPRGNILDSTLG